MSVGVHLIVYVHILGALAPARAPVPATRPYIVLVRALPGVRHVQERTGGCGNIIWQHTGVRERARVESSAWGRMRACGSVREPLTVRSVRHGMRTCPAGVCRPYGSVPGRVDHTKCKVLNSSLPSGETP